MRGVALAAASMLLLIPSAAPVFADESIGGPPQIVIQEGASQISWGLHLVSISDKVLTYEGSRAIFSTLFHSARVTVDRSTTPWSWKMWWYARELPGPTGDPNYTGSGIGFRTIDFDNSQSGADYGQIIVTADSCAYLDWTGHSSANCGG